MIDNRLVTDNDHGNRGGGPLHNTATSDVAGFMSAADKATLDAVSSSGFLRNRIINGDMRVNQWNAGTSVTVNNAAQFFAVDRFHGYGQAADGVFTLQQVADAPAGFRNSLRATVTTADASVGAGQYYFVSQRVEGFNVADWGLGVSTAQTFTLSFWVKSSVTGTFGGSVGNNADLSNPFSYTINSPNTWEYKIATFRSPASGTWNSTNGVGIMAVWSLGMGSSLEGPAGTWANYPFAPTGSVDLISTPSATWAITGVQLEAGSIATPFERRQFGTELLLGQRYYCLFNCAAGGAYPTTSGAFAISAFSYPVAMRATPTITAGTLVASVNILSDSFGSFGGNEKGGFYSVTQSTTVAGNFYAARANNTALIEL